MVIILAEKMKHIKKIKETLFSPIFGYEIKESKRGYIRGGYIATTHLDEGFYDEERGIYIRDRISKETLEKWAEEINNGVPRANKVSVHHMRDIIPVGVGIKGSARVDRLPDGEYGLYVETLIDETLPDFEDIKYKIENDLLDSFSIEFRTRDIATGDYLEGAVTEINKGDYIERILLPGTILDGWTLASRPMNEHAIMIKEIIGDVKMEEKAQVSNFEEIRKKKGMSVEEFYAVPRDPPSSSKLPIFDAAHVRNAMARFSQTKGLTPEERRKAINKIIRAAKKFGIDASGFIEKYKNKKEEVVKMEVEHKEEDVQKQAPAEEPKEKAQESAPEEKEVKISKDDLALLKEAKERKMQEAKEKEYQEMKERILRELKEQVEKMKVETKAQAESNDVVETKELIEYKEVLKNPNKIPIDEQFRIAARFAESKGLFNGDWKTKDVFERKYNINSGSRFLEYKALGLTTNQNTDTDYLLSAAELNDVFDPVIYNALNQKTVTWNLLAKDDYSNKGNNLVQFTLKTAANTTAGAYTGDAVSTGNVTRMKFMTKFKKYAVGFAISGDMIAAARGGPIGDIVAQEIKDATEDLLKVINQDLFKENGAETGAEIIGFEYIADSAGNTTLYNLTRSSSNKLAPDSASDTYINGNSARISLSNLRAAKRQALKEGADINNLVFITNPVQADLFRSIYDAAQRPVPTSSRFGFEGRPEFDGIPIFEDTDCNSDDWFLVDLETHRVAIWVPPTVEMLGKDSDSVKGFIKTYFAVYNRAPRRLVMIYGNATS